MENCTVFLQIKIYFEINISIKNFIINIFTQNTVLDNMYTNIVKCSTSTCLFCYNQLVKTLLQNEKLP